MFERFFEALGSVLNFFYTLIPNYGIAIMLLTVLVMVLITPLTVKSTRSMLQMQRLQPEMKRLQKEHKDDRQKLNEELMKFYKENNINPLGGCLPILATMPVFFIMYSLLRDLTIRQGGLGSGVGHIAGQVQQRVELTPWIATDQLFQPKHLNHASDLYQSLSSTNTMNFFGMDLAMSAAQALKLGLLIAIPYLLLLLVILGTGLYQNRQLQARNKSAAAANPQQQMLMKIMPFFLPVFSFGFPSGLALYWATQNACRIGTNAYITRSVYKKEHARDVIDTTATEKGTGSKKSSDAKQGGAARPASNKAGQGRAGQNKAGQGRAGKNEAAGQAKATGDRKASSSIGRGGARARSDADDAPTTRTPGSSVKSQKARENAASGDSRRSGSGGKRSVNQRRSGETRGSRRGSDGSDAESGDDVNEKE